MGFVKNLTLAGLVAGSAALGYVGVTAPERQAEARVESKVESREQPAPESETPEWYSALVALGFLAVSSYLIAKKVRKPLPIFGLTGQEDPYKRQEESYKGK